ncbi:hypothetical protein AC229_0619 [Oenococcus oeni]|nr:hypothetical protein AC229_0619 [Oenococcus oeni]
MDKTFLLAISKIIETFKQFIRMKYYYHKKEDLVFEEKILS